MTARLVVRLPRLIGPPEEAEAAREQIKTLAVFLADAGRDAQMLDRLFVLLRAPERITVVEAIERIIGAVGDRLPQQRERLFEVALREIERPGIVPDLDQRQRPDQLFVGDDRLLQILVVVLGEAEVEEPFEIARIVLRQLLELIDRLVVFRRRK